MSIRSRLSYGAAARHRWPLQILPWLHLTRMCVRFLMVPAVPRRAVLLEGAAAGTASPSRPLRVAYANLFHRAGPDTQVPWFVSTQEYGTCLTLIGDPRHHQCLICRRSPVPQARSVAAGSADPHAAEVEGGQVRRDEPAGSESQVPSFE